MRRLRVLITVVTILNVLPTMFFSSAHAQESACTVSMGEYGYDSDTRTNFIEKATVTSTFLALVECSGQSLPSSHTFRISFNGYSCRPFTRAFPENPSDYTGTLPDGYRGSLQVAVDGVGEQTVPIFTASKRHSACGRKRACRRSLGALTKREKSRLCAEFEDRIIAPRKIIIIGK